MSKSKKSKNPKRKNNSIKIVVLIIIAAIVVLIMSDFFKPKKSSERLVETRTEQVYSFKKEGELTFQSEDGKYIETIDIEFADNYHERAQGLMYRTEMEENHGMLFIFPTEEIQSFFMKNTVISLDMIFINSDLQIVTIHKNTTPHDIGSYPSTKPAQYVLETIAGYTDKYNIKENDKVVFRKTN